MCVQILPGQCSCWVSRHHIQNETALLWGTKGICERREKKAHKALDRNRWFIPHDPLPTESRKKGVKTLQTFASQLSTVKLTTALHPYCISQCRSIHVKMSIKDVRIKRGFTAYSFYIEGFTQLLLFGSATGNEFFQSLKVAVHVARSVYSH